MQLSTIASRQRPRPAASCAGNCRRCGLQSRPPGEQNAGYIEARGRPVSEKLIERVDPRPGERVLELACGTVPAGLLAAPLVEPGGELVISDFSAEMTSIAAARSAELELDDVSARPLDLEAIEEPEESYDIALCREGLMLVPEPERAAREILRGPRKRNPWLSLVFDAVGEQLGGPMPPPGLPHPFSLEDSEHLAAVLDAAGFSAIEVFELPTPYLADDPEQWWERTSALAGPLSQALASLPQPAADQLRERAIAAISRYKGPDGLEIPGVSLVASPAGPPPTADPSTPPHDGGMFWFRWNRLVGS